MECITFLSDEPWTGQYQVPGAVVTGYLSDFDTLLLVLALQRKHPLRFLFFRGRLFTGQIVHHESCQAQANLH